MVMLPLYYRMIYQCYCILKTYSYITMLCPIGKRHPNKYLSLLYIVICQLIFLSVRFDGRKIQVLTFELLYSLWSLVQVCVDWSFVDISSIA